ncbi:MAG TPA: response regulator transcription factor [Burkholderiaceae bacterium]|nr:response regulator transcription factor [Burkholderiaceae bacterium]
MLVDDHEVVRLGLRTLFARTETIEVVGEAGSVAQAISEAGRVRPDVILMDFRLPDGTGRDACRELRAADQSMRVLFLTSYSDDEAVMSTILAGAAGYLLKEIGQQALVRAVEAVAGGQSILDPKITEPVLKRIHALTQRTQSEHEDGLSPQECRVLALVVQGKTNKEIAAALELSDKTVKNYLSNAFQKLQVNRRYEAAAAFTRRSGKPRADLA